jgi:hypothetical protein
MKGFFSRKTLGSTRLGMLIAGDKTSDFEVYHLYLDPRMH